MIILKKYIFYYDVFSYIILFFMLPVIFPCYAVYPDEQDKIHWNKRYRTEEYIFGREPAEFLREHISILPPGRALDIAMGEGRNAVFLAKNGYAVDGYDISEVAIEKARGLAEEKGVIINAMTVDLENYKLPENTYNVVVCFYYLQRDLIPQIKNTLKPGGMVVYETYTIENLEKGFEGPRKKEYLLKPNELLHFFADFKIIFYRELVVNNKAIASLIAQKQ